MQDAINEECALYAKLIFKNSALPQNIHQLLLPIDNYKYKCYNELAL